MGETVKIQKNHIFHESTKIHFMQELSKNMLYEIHWRYFCFHLYEVLDFST